MDEGAEEIFSIDMCVFSVCVCVCVCVGGGVGGWGGLGQMRCLKFFTLSWGEGDKVKSSLNFKLGLIIKFDYSM